MYAYKYIQANINTYIHEGFWESLPCSLLLSPLCEVCPPLEGPGVPPERVEAVSSWSLFHEVCTDRKEETAHSQAADHRDTVQR